jgi:hypothetical protein
VEQGNSVSFWNGDWNHGIMQNNYPCLYSHVLNEDSSVAGFSQMHDLSDMFHLPLTPEAFEDWEQLHNITNENLQITVNNDKWKYNWGHLHQNSSKITT